MIRKSVVFLSILLISLLAGCTYHKDFYIKNTDANDHFEQIHDYFKKHKPDVLLEKTNWDYMLYSVNKEAKVLELYIYAHQDQYSRNIQDKPIGLDNENLVASVKITVEQADKDVKVIIDALQFKRPYYFEIEDAYRAIEQLINPQHSFKKSENKGIVPQHNKEFSSVWPYAANQNEKKTKDMVVNRKSPQSVEDSLLIADHYLAFKFRDNKGNILFQFNPLTSGVIGMGGFYLTNSIESLNKDSVENPISTAITPLWFPYVFFHINGPYKYQNYPFEIHNSFLSRTEGKNWTSNANVSWFPTGKSFGLEGNLYYEQLGLNTELLISDSWRKVSITPLYHFARNDFFDFTAGVGYSFFNKSENGLNLRYGIDFYLKPLHSFYAISYTTNFQREIGQQYQAGLGLVIDNYEIQLIYHCMTRTYAQDQQAGIKAQIQLWF
ncbi:MAG: hypothetical protein GY730_05110 [bacterium]|nr:hypothetical protein [bacterium]